MGAELVRGQNHPLPGNRWEIRVSAGTPVVAAVTLGDEQGRVLRDLGAPPGAGAAAGAGAGTGASHPGAGDAWLAHPGTPRVPGVEVPRQAAADHALVLDLGALPEPVRRVHVLLALPTGPRGGPGDFGAAPAPRLAVTAPDGDTAAGFTITGLGPETALLALELYQRQGVWKVRAVGQGYADGLAALLLDQGVAEAVALAGEIHAAADPERSRAGAVLAQGAPAASVPAEGAGAAASVTPAAAGRTAAPGPAATSAAAQAPAPTASTTSAAAPAGQAPAPAASAPMPAAGDTGTGVDYRHPRRRTAAAQAPRTRGGTPPARSGSPAGTPPQPVPAQASHAPALPAQVPPVAGYDPPAPPDPPAAPVLPTDPDDAPPVPLAGEASGWTMEERLHNQIWGMFEDLARTVAAYRGAADFAESRYDQEMDRLLADPRTRNGLAAEVARDDAQLKQAELVDQARAVLDRDLAQLTAEAEAVEPALPPAFAGWENPVWHAYQVPAERPMAVRLGSLTLPEAPELRIPLLARLPLDRGLWLDTAEDGRGALAVAVAVAARLLASYPVGGFAVNILDPAGSGAAALAALYAAGAPVLPPPAAGAEGVSQLLDRLTDRVDLLQMAARGGAPDALPAGFDTAGRLLIVNAFPYGFDDRAVTQLRYLADEGPAVGVHLLMVADRADADRYGPVLDPFWRSLLRLTPNPSDHLADPWVGHVWTYEPALVPPGSQVLGRVLRQLSAAGPAFGP